jgi:hypothetical protein
VTERRFRVPLVPDGEFHALSVILLKNTLIIPSKTSESIEFIAGTTGGAVEIIGDNPFMLGLVEAFLGYLWKIFSRLSLPLIIPLSGAAARGSP